MLDRPIQNEYGKIELNVCGLEIMQGSADKTRVLYAKIQSESLQKIADSITKSFIDAGECTNIDLSSFLLLTFFLCFL